MKRLLITDVDGVLFHDKNVWIELHKALGTWEEGKELTAKYLKTDYARLVKEVIGRLWAGKPAKPYFDLIASRKFVDGAKEFFKAAKDKSYVTAVISSGPYDLGLRAKCELDIDEVCANRLLIENDSIVGTEDISLWPIKYDEKVPALLECCKKHGIKIADVTAVLHDDNDVALAKFIHQCKGKVIGFMYDSHVELEKHCTHIVQEKDLRVVLPFI